MAKIICVILLLTTTVMIKADIKEETIKYLKLFAEQTKDAKNNLDFLKANSKRDLKLKFDEIQLKSHEETMMKLEKAKAMAERNSCGNLVNTQLDAVHAKLSDRWDSCFNFTQAILDFTKYLYDSSTGYESIELLFCNGIQNVSICSGNFLEKWHCVTNELQEFIEEVTAHSGDFISIVEAANDMIETIISQAMSCFTKISKVTDGHIQMIMLNKCRLPVSNIALQVN